MTAPSHVPEHMKHLGQSVRFCTRELVWRKTALGHTTKNRAFIQQDLHCLEHILAILEMVKKAAPSP